MLNSSTPLDNLNLFELVDGNVRDNRFEIDVPCGFQQNFYWTGFVLEFEQVPLD